MDNLIGLWQRPEKMKLMQFFSDKKRNVSYIENSDK